MANEEARASFRVWKGLLKRVRLGDAVPVDGDDAGRSVCHRDVHPRVVGKDFTDGYQSATADPISIKGPVSHRIAAGRSPKRK